MYHDSLWQYTVEENVVDKLTSHQDFSGCRSQIFRFYLNPVLFESQQILFYDTFLAESALLSSCRV